MLTTVEGVFRDGRIELCEAPPGIEEARVIVTFLPEPSESGGASLRSASEANRRMLALLQTWRAEPLTEDEERLINDFDDAAILKALWEAEEQATAEAYARQRDSPDAPFDPAVWEGRSASGKR